MQTTLTYRLPDKEIVTLQGSFCAIEDIDTFTGFIVSNFEGSQFFGFNVDTNTEEQQAIQEPIVIQENGYLDLAHEFIHYLQDHTIGKAILSRVKKVAFTADASTLFTQLCEKYPKAFCYYFDSPMLGKWLGATPETLIQYQHSSGSTMSLAGTKPSSDTSNWGEKEKGEQAMVTQFIAEQLQLHSTEVNCSPLEELVAGPVKHLVNYFSFVTSPEKQWQQAATLHPTPAVSGFPRKEALRCIENFEPHDRRFYAGIIGLKEQQNTQLFVNLRCGEIIADNLFVYVGGGLTQQSIPQDEWTETENKAKTLLALAEQL